MQPGSCYDRMDRGVDGTPRFDHSRVEHAGGSDLRVLEGAIHRSRSRSRPGLDPSSGMRDKIESGCDAMRR